MKNHCAFSKNHSCPLWTDYELTCYELEEANSLCHGNWIEIERQRKRTTVFITVILLIPENILTITFFCFL